MNFKSINKNIKYERSKKGIIAVMYAGQVSNSKKRGHNLPSYTKEWFKTWLQSNPEFHRLYDLWVISNYDKDLKPSVDRKNEEISYTEYNIQLMTWKENFLLEHKNLTKRKSKVVIQSDLNGKYIAEYKSVREAERQTGINNISSVCKPRVKSKSKFNLYPSKQKQAGGYRWEYKG